MRSENMRHALRCLGIGLIGAAIWGCASSQSAPIGELTPYQARISDHAIDRDLSAFDHWRVRLDRLDPTDSGTTAYHHAKAAGWLTLGREEYQVNDNSGIVEAAFAEAKRLIGRLESGDVPRVSETLPPPGSVRLRHDLWEIAEDLKDHPGFRCAAPAVARLEVELVWAGNVELTCGPNDPRNHLAAADIAAREAQRLAGNCAVAVPAKLRLDERNVKPELKPTLAPIPATLIVPNVIHFAFDKASISTESAAVLDRIAQVVAQYPDLRVVMFGHTDSRGSDTYNYALARRRAESAHMYLLDKGIDPKQLRVVSEGEARLIRGGASRVEHAYNRRVEFEFYTSVGRRIETVLQESDLQIEGQGERE